MVGMKVSRHHVKLSGTCQQIVVNNTSGIFKVIQNNRKPFSFYGKTAMINISQLHTFIVLIPSTVTLLLADWLYLLPDITGYFKKHIVQFAGVYSLHIRIILLIRIFFGFLKSNP